MKALALFIFLLTHVFAEECKPISPLELQGLITTTRNRYFPDLAGINIQIKEFTSKAYFLQAKPCKSLRRASRRQYEIQVNPSLYACSPGVAGLEAILVHELEHVRDYIALSTLELGSLGMNYLASKKWRAAYERKTDMKVLEQGLGPGLIEYREWIYKRLSPQDLRRKKRYYLTPDEIRALSNP